MDRGVGESGRGAGGSQCRPEVHPLPKFKTLADSFLLGTK